jgi:aspartyl-tRNA synthetase
MRTHACGELRAEHAGADVTLCGWVARRRDLGELIFLTVRDRSGLVQVVFDKARCPADAVSGANEARSEDVVAIEGEVILRGEGQRNKDLPTGEIEVLAARLELGQFADDGTRNRNAPESFQNTAHVSRARASPKAQ